jgi:hypothetical protein
LLSKGRGSHAQPGEFRKSQNWIGGSRPGNAAYVPPPPEYVMDCLGDLESFLHEEANSLPLLIRAGLVHAQFETIPRARFWRAGRFSKMPVMLPKSCSRQSRAAFLPT